ncbi:MAG: hypothetical protein ABI624_21205, partial [Casimicrobiaceae bacterium]
MSTRIDPLAGKPAPRAILVDVPRLVTAYYTGKPDPAEAGCSRCRWVTSGLPQACSTVHWALV